MQANLGGQPFDDQPRVFKMLKFLFFFSGILCAAGSTREKLGVELPGGHRNREKVGRRWGSCLGWIFKGMDEEKGCLGLGKKVIVEKKVSWTRGALFESQRLQKRFGDSGVSKSFLLRGVTHQGKVFGLHDYLIT